MLLVLHHPTCHYRYSNNSHKQPTEHSTQAGVRCYTDMAPNKKCTPTYANVYLCMCLCVFCAMIYAHENTYENIHWPAAYRTSQKHTNIRTAQKSIKIGSYIHRILALYVRLHPCAKHFREYINNLIDVRVCAVLCCAVLCLCVCVYSFCPIDVPHTRWSARNAQNIGPWRMSIAAVRIVPTTTTKAAKRGGIPIFVPL